MATAERLHKVLARAGVASRRDCEALIVAGRVQVNGEVVDQLGTCVDAMRDRVLVDGVPIQPQAERVYIMLHKPPGVVSTTEDPQRRTTIIDLINIETRVFPVGRLDADSEGLLLLTNDGDLTYHMTHPQFEVEKEYRVLLDRKPDAVALRRWRRGVLLYGRPTASARVDVLEEGNEGVWLRVVLHEGRKRQIREVARLLGYEVRRLIRTREGVLRLGNLPSGAWRYLHEDEIEAVRSHIPAAVRRETLARTDSAHAAGVAPAARNRPQRAQREQPARRSSKPPASRQGQQKRQKPRGQ